MVKINNVASTITSFKNMADGTYDYCTGQQVDYNTGYQVSFVRPEAFEVLNEQQWDIITCYLCEYLDSKAHIGVYCNEAEVSFHSISKNKAIEIMIKFNQESILDWKNKNANPQKIESWFIFNQSYDASRKVNYNEFIEEIQ